MTLLSIDQPQARPVEEGELVYAVAISAANIIRDIREHITNTLGGRMTRYEQLTDDTIARALSDLEGKAKAKGYDGVMAVQIGHPRIVDGGVGIVAYGTAFRYRDRS
jgi:uncharacterized protein YbjQ (UPF0145 family)